MTDEYLFPVDTSCAWNKVAWDALPFDVLCQPFADFGIANSSAGHANYTQCLDVPFFKLSAPSSPCVLPLPRRLWERTSKSLAEPECRRALSYWHDWHVQKRL